MGIVLAVIAYVAALVFYATMGLHAARWLRPPADGPGMTLSATGPGGSSAASGALALFDLLTLRRLLVVNPVLWVGEWLFHASVLLVGLRHTRYFFHTVPDVIVLLQPLGRLAGYTLTASLIYILLYRVTLGRHAYRSARNITLSSLFLLAGGSGLFMRYFDRADVVAVKHYMLALLSGTPLADAPGGAAMVVHFLSFLAVLTLLPTHVYSAPLTLYDSRQRERQLGRFVHER